MIGYFVKHPVAATILMITACILGLSVISGMERESFPEFAASRVSVTVIYPGASATDVDEQVCAEIDGTLNGVADLDEIECQSTEARANATLTMAEGGDINQFFNDVLSQVQAMQGLPDDAEEPTVAIAGREGQIVLLAVTGIDQTDHLLRYVDELADTLAALPSVSGANVTGISPREFRVSFDQLALRRYGLSAREVVDAVTSRSLNQPLGTVSTSDRDVTLRYEGASRTIEDLENIVVLDSVTGGFVRLSDVATIRLIAAAPEKQSFIDGQEAATISVLKTGDADAIEAFAEIEEVIAREESRLPDPFEIVVINNQTENISERIVLVVKNVAVGLVLVLVVMALFFPIGQAFWISAALPISFLGGFFVLSLLGVTINMISLIAMLMAVGLIMDDSIVIADNIDKWRGNVGGRAASIMGASEVAPGILSSFLTTACVFTPLMFLTGEIGSILEVVPIVLLVILGISLVEAFLVLPNHLSHSHARPEQQAKRIAPRAVAWLTDRVIVPVAQFNVSWRYAILGLTFGALIASFGLVASGTVKVVGFPTSEGDTIESRIALTAGSPLERTEATVENIVAALEGVDAEYSPGTIGGVPLIERVLVRYATNPDVRNNGPHTATVTVDLLGSDYRNVSADDVAATWERLSGPLPDLAQSSFVQTAGTPGGADLDVQLSSRNLADLEAATAALYAQLVARPDVTGAYQDFSGGQAQVVLELNTFGYNVGLTPQSLSAQLRSAFSGTETDSFTEGFTDIAVRVEIGDSVPTIEDLNAYPISVPGGDQTALARVADIRVQNGYAQITRQDGAAIARIIGTIDRDATTSSVISNEIRNVYAPQIAQDFPSVTVGIGGAAESTQETQSSIVTSLLIGLIGVYLILAFQFRNYTLPVVVMLSIPFAMIGVILGHMAIGIDLSMPSFIGFASLAGIVVNNAILFVTFFELESEDGNAITGAVEAVRQRFRPVLLSFATTFVGLLPIVFETSPQAQTMVPLVAAVAFGLLSSTILTVFVLPAALAIYFDWASLEKWRAKRDTDDDAAFDSAPAPKTHIATEE